MISHRRHSTSVSNDYHKKKYHQNKYNPPIHSKSDSFFQEDFNNIDFQYLYSKNLKSNGNIVSKIPLIEIKFQTKANLKKSFSSDSIKLYQISKNLQRSSNNKEKISNKNENNTNSTNLIRNSLSCYNLQSLLNYQHNLYSIHGRIPCFIKSIQRIDYNQYISLEYQKDFSHFDSIEFFNRDDRINEREVDFIQKYRTIRFFSRNRNNQKNIKKNRKNESNKTIDSSPQKPRFNLYCSKNPTPIQKKSIYNQSPRLSSAFILNEKYNIRSRVFKENNIRKFYKELAKAEEDDKRFVFEFEKKRSRSIEKNSPYRTVPLKKVKRSKSTQNTIDYRKYFINSSSSSSPAKLNNRPRFKLFSPRNPSRPISKKTERENQSPKPSPASVLNEKYNIRSRLFKEMHIHEFYKDLAAAEEEEKVKKSLKQVQMSPRSKKIVENYMQRINQTESKNKDKQGQSENDNQSISSNLSPKLNQSDSQSIKSNHDKIENDLQSQIEKENKNFNNKTSQSDSQSIKSFHDRIESDLQSEKNNHSQSNNDNKSNSSKQSQGTKDYKRSKNLNSKLSQNGNDNQNNVESDSKKEKYDQNQSNASNLKINKNMYEIKERNVKQTNEESSKKESEEVNPPQIKKFYHKVPGFISNVSNFLDEYNISIRYDTEKSNSKQKRKRKKI